MLSRYGDYELWPFVYGYRFVVPFPAAGGNFISPKNPMPIQGDADFIWRGLALDTSDPTHLATTLDFSGQSPLTQTNWLLTLSTPDDYRLVTLQSTVGAVANPLPLFGQPNNGPGLTGSGMMNAGSAAWPLAVLPERMLRKATTLFADIGNINGFSNLSVEIALHGVKLSKPGTHYRLDRTRRWLAQEYTYPSLLPAPAPGTTVPNNIVQLDGDSAFLLLAVYSHQQFVVSYQYQFYGANLEQTSNGLIGGGNLIGTSRYPRAVCPPMEFPPAGQIVYDFRVPTPAPAQDGDRPAFLLFKGLKLYPA